MEKEIVNVLNKILIEIRGHKPLLSIREAAAYFDVSERSMRRFIKDNDDILTIKEPGIGLRIVKSSIDSFISNRTEREIKKIADDDAYIKSIVDKAMSRN